MAGIMSGVVSLVISVINLGWIEGIIGIWLKGWALAFLVAFPTVIFVAPLANKLSLVVVSKD
ncbi:MAG: DUF2798 domain-containing protein [Oleibacter sp.]|nr:DUF2798 domain-containing protein [Thalassolituus sp.]